MKDQIKEVNRALEDKNLIDALKGVFTLIFDINKQIESTRKYSEESLRKLMP